MIVSGYFACHFAHGQCSKSSRTQVRTGFTALAVNKLPAPITPGLQMQAEYAFVLFEEEYLRSRPKSRLFFGKKHNNIP